MNMGHGLWHASGRPTATLGKPLHAGGESSDTRIVRGDRLTVRKNGAQVRIFVEYVDKETVEGTVIGKARDWRKGQWISARRADVLRNREYVARVTQSELD